MAQDSASWKNPSDIMVLHRRKRRSVAKQQSRRSASASTTTGSPGSGRRVEGRLKRRNPFGCSPRKQPRTEDALGGCEDGSVIGRLDTSAKPATVEQEDSPQSPVQDYVQDVLRCDKSPPINPPHEEELTMTEDNECSPQETLSSHPPIDWSLKRKLRFVSDQTFNWCSPLKTMEEASGLCEFVQGTNETLQEAKDDAGRMPVTQSDFHKCCLFWIHPNLPWMNLFPRIVMDNRIGIPCPSLQSEKVQKALMVDWCESLTSAFHLVRARRSPYFYVCTHQLTVLFRAAGVAGHARMHAIITPTSRGFRAALTSEGIEFIMPLSEKKQLTTSEQTQNENKSTDSQENRANLPDDAERRDEDDGVDHEDIVQTDDGAQTWLEDLGLDKSHYRCLQPTKVSLQREDFRTIDGRPESTVLVTGSQTLALLNYLLNCRGCVSATGSQAGLPPTLLSPTPFTGATLRSLKVKQCAIKLAGADGHIQPAHVLELTGPLLPLSVHALHRLLPRAHPNYTCTANTYEPTVALNCTSPPPGGQEDGQTDAPTPSHLQHLREGDRLGRQAVHEVVCEDGRLSWTV